MTRPPQSPQISFRETATPPRFAGLTLPSALREVVHPENSPNVTPRRTEMSALANRLRKISLDISPTGKRSSPADVVDVNPSRLEFDDDLDKENVSRGSGPAGTAIWGVQGDDLAVKANADALEEAAAKTNVHLPGKSSDQKEGTEEEKGSTGTERQVTEGRSEAKHSSLRYSKADSGVRVQKGREVGSAEMGVHTEDSKRLSPVVDRSENKEQFQGNLQKILDGKHKWPWLERCRAMSSVAETLSNGPTQEVAEYTKSVLKNLSSKLNDHLDELRPSVITSALGLVNSVIALNFDGGHNFAVEVFPSIMDLACGRSLTAQEAARSLALILSHHSELEPGLGDADNIDRLCDILQQQANSLTNADFRERASSALKMAQKVADESGRTRSSRSPGHERDEGISRTPSPRSGHSPQTSSSPTEENKTFRMESSHARLASFRGRLSARFPLTTGQNPARSLHRASVCLARTPSADESSSRSPSPRVGDTSVELRNGATVIRNTKLRGSVRKPSPGSMRKQRMYTEEEVEEISRQAIQTAEGEAARAYEKEREGLTKAKDELERKLKVETSQVDELKSVLEEYQLTMQTMVAQGNTKINAQNTALITEKNRLKADLLEVSESFEALKEKYEDSKKNIELFEAKENRFIEQIKELKKNMVDLQQWSNDLKANTEKKLSKAFESVTSYRASYIDKEAHAQKAISDLERTRTELASEQKSHAETAAKFSQAEAELHREQDARSSAEASLASAKATLSRITSQKDRLQSELDTAKDNLSETKTKLLEIESIASRVSETQSQLDSVIVENQSLKARAYDDMTQIKSLEVIVKEKDAELEEMSAICEEAMERLERGKLNGT